MAETMRRCEAHGSDWYRDWCVITEMARREGHRVVDLDPCRPVEGVWSAPGELIDPADPADILAAVRTLPGVEEAEASSVEYDERDYEILYVEKPGRYLVVPLSEEE